MKQSQLKRKVEKKKEKKRKKGRKNKRRKRNLALASKEAGLASAGTKTLALVVTIVDPQKFKVPDFLHVAGAGVGTIIIIINNNNHLIPLIMVIIRTRAASALSDVDEST